MNNSLINKPSLGTLELALSVGFNNNKVRALIAKDLRRLHNQYISSNGCPYGFFHSFRFSTISMCKATFFISFSTSILQFIFNLSRFLFESSKLPLSPFIMSSGL